MTIPTVEIQNLLFVETTIMRKTADLEVMQKTNIETFHKKGKSQRVITERGGCSQSAVSKHIKCKVDWKEGIGEENVHKQQWWPQTRDYHQTKLIQTLERASQGVNWSECIKSHHTQTSSGKGLPRYFWNRNIVRSILPGLRRKITGLLLSGSTSPFQIKVNVAFYLEIKVPESGGRVERHRIQAAWSLVWSFRSQWWFGLPWRLLVLVHCVLLSPKSMQPSTKRFWSTLCFHLLTSFMEMLISFSSRTLTPAHRWQNHFQVITDHDITVLDLTANMPDLNPIENLWNIFKRKMRNSQSNNTDELKAQ